MRQTLRFLASVKPVRYLEAGTPTGLTGLRTHHSPHSSLRLLYNTTLDKLKAVPEHSLYRQSVEATTKHRLALVEGVVPAGWAAWRDKAAEAVRKHPKDFDPATALARGREHAYTVERNGQTFIVQPPPKVEVDPRELEWDGEPDEPQLEVERSASEGADQVTHSQKVEGEKRPSFFALPRNTPSKKRVELDPEPQLTAQQIEDLEQKIDAGLIEEVIQVAQGELKLLDIMVQSKAWESSEEKPEEGQWVYFERKNP